MVTNDNQTVFQAINGRLVTYDYTEEPIATLRKMKFPHITFGEMLGPKTPSDGMILTRSSFCPDNVAEINSYFRRWIQ